LLILSAPDVDTNISNSNNKYLDCDPKSYAEVDFLRVNNIQTFLKNENFFDGKVGGYFDEKLLSGLKKFQQSVGIRIDGIMGPSTHKAMTSYDKCEKKVQASMINCGEYFAYRECTFFVNAFDTIQPDKEIEIPLSTTSTEEDITNKKDCDDGGKLWHGDIGTLWNAASESVSYTNCDEFTIAKNKGYDFTEKPIPGVTPGVGAVSSSDPNSSGLVINNLSGTVSINENQKSVVTYIFKRSW
jgi:hypothetical protein